jgi:hypothetical protein
MRSGTRTDLLVDRRSYAASPVLEELLAVVGREDDRRWMRESLRADNSAPNARSVNWISPRYRSRPPGPGAEALVTGRMREIVKVRIEVVKPDEEGLLRRLEKLDSQGRSAPRK